MRHRGRFILAYVILALALAAPYTAYYLRGSFHFAHHTHAAMTPRPPAKTSKLLARMVAERFLGALVPPVDYARVCDQVEFKATCLRDWPHMAVAVHSFELRGVAVFSTVVEVGVSMDGLTGVLEMKWHGTDFLISNLVQD